MPNPLLLEEHRARLTEIVGTPLPESVDEAVVIGVDQRTSESFDLVPSGNGWSVEPKLGWSGDGVVVPASSGAGERLVYLRSACS